MFEKQNDFKTFKKRKVRNEVSLFKTKKNICQSGKKNKLNS